MMRSVRQGFLYSILLFATMGLAGKVIAQSGPQAMLTWKQQTSGLNRVMVSILIDDQWQEPEVIVETDHAIATSTLGKLNQYTIAAVWSERDSGRVDLKSAFFDLRTSTWSKARSLFDQGGSNMNPVIVYSRLYGAWLFWDSSLSGKTDVIMMNQSEGAGWSDISRVNTPNEVPDFRPQVDLISQTQARVSWQQLNKQALRYETVSRQLDFATLEISKAPFIATDVSSLPTSADQAPNIFESTISESAELTLGDITLPNFAPDDLPVTLFFPNNELSQSIRLNER